MLTYDPNKDAYAILGVDYEASPAEINAAYRRAALTWHPDKSPVPDAAERFHEIKQAARILRDTGRRREYDLLRRRHLGPRAQRRQRRRKAPEPYVPMTPPPGWLAEKVRIHFDAVLINLETPQVARRTVTTANALAFMALGASVTTGDFILFALALVFWGIGRVLQTPPHKGLLSWAKIIPGRRVAEYHVLDQRANRYDRFDVPFGALSISIVRSGSRHRIEIRGFPHKAVPVLHRTRDPDEAQRCAREAGRWLQLPLRKAA